MNGEGTLDLAFDQYQRYRIAAEIVRLVKKERGRDRLKILDVGGCANRRDGTGYFLPLLLFFPWDDCTVLDRAEYEHPAYVQGDGCALNFQNDAFDVTVCNDVLEHVPPSSREDLVGQLIRVTRSYLILAAPVKTEANELAERLLLNFIEEKLGTLHQQLKEHSDLGLPRREEVEEILKSRRAVFFSFPSGNLYHWFQMMLLKHHLMSLPGGEGLHWKMDRLYNINLWDDAGLLPAYRYFFVVFKDVPDPSKMMEDIREHIRLRDWKRMEGNPEALFDSMVKLIWASHPLVEEFASDLVEANQHLEEANQRLSRLEKFYQAVNASMAYKTYRGIKKILKLEDADP